MHARAAGHARVFGEPEARERAPLVIVHRGKVAYSLEHRDRVRSADSHAATSFDGDAVALGDLEERAPGRGDHPLAVRLERHLRSTLLGGLAVGELAGAAEPHQRWLG